MPLYKGTFFFKSGLYGWSESFYDTKMSIAQALTHFGDLKTARLALLNRSSQLVALRVSDDAIFRDSQVITYAGADAQGTAGPADDTGQQPYDALVYRCEGGPLQRRSYLVRGIPTGVVDATGVYAPSPFWLPLAAAFRGVLVNGFGNPDGFEFKHSTSTAELAVTALITTPGNNRAISIPVAAAPAAVVNSVIRIKGVTTMNNANGLWRVRSIAGGQLVMYPRQRSVLGTYGGEGFAQIVTYTSVDITSLIPVRGVRRSTGRPFDAPRGRRRQVNR